VNAEKVSGDSLKMIDMHCCLPPTAAWLTFATKKSSLGKQASGYGRVGFPSALLNQVNPEAPVISSEKGQPQAHNTHD
jgi:hypothetical protein